MKRIALIILSVLVLSACTPKAYTENMDAGKAALQEGNYSIAIEKFENALKEKQTDEAKNDLQIAKTLNESLSLYHKGNFDAAIYSLTKLLNDNAPDKTDSRIIKQAKTLLKEIQHAKALSDSMQEKIIKGKTLLEQNQFDQAIEVFKQVSETNTPADIAPMEKITKDAAELLDETTKKKNDAEQKQQQQKEAEKQKADAQQKAAEQQKQEAANKTLTSKQAEDLVRAQLVIQPGQNVKVEYDHDAPNGDYVIHVYEFIVDNPSTGEGHTSTWGWYGVNKQTKKIYNVMQ
jgi:tetratricopeptide (TPR) repeat protein